jgi:hypothetical protein
MTLFFFDIDTAAQMINAADVGIHAFRHGGCSELLDASTKCRFSLDASF